MNRLKCLVTNFTNSCRFLRVCKLMTTEITFRLEFLLACLTMKSFLCFLMYGLVFSQLFTFREKLRALFTFKHFWYLQDFPLGPRPA